MTHPTEGAERLSAEELAKLIVSWAFSECQPKRGDVFAWLDDHAQSLASFLNEHLSAPQSQISEERAWGLVLKEADERSFGETFRAMLATPFGSYVRTCAIVAIQSAVSEASGGAEAMLLSALDAHGNWELCKGYDGDNEDFANYGWCVHSVNGGPNDREWTLIGFGETAAGAIRAAIKTAKPTGTGEKT